MKTLGRIKLNQLSKEELENRELKALVGGCQGYCCCRNLKDYPLNMDANVNGGYHVPGGGEVENILPPVDVYGTYPKK